MPRHLATDRPAADPIAVDRIQRLRPPKPAGSGWLPDRYEIPDDDDDDDDDEFNQFDQFDRDPEQTWNDDDAGTVDPGVHADLVGDDPAGSDVQNEAPAVEPAVEPAAEPEALRAKRIRAGPWRRLAETWVPEPMRDARIDPGRRGALILSLVAALAAVAAAIGVWRDRPEPRPIQPVASAPLTDTVGLTGDPSIIRTGGAAAGKATSAARSGERQRSSTSPGQGQNTATEGAAAGAAIIAVSVTGLVRGPGLVQLPAGSRVADAIAAAGGVAAGGSLTGLNLAQKLSDGDSVVVGPQSPTPLPGSGPKGAQTVPATGRPAATGTAAAPGGAAGSAPLDLNTADAAALEVLPGVGPVMAGNIVAWREANGSFKSVDQLQEVSGIGPTRFAQLAPLVTVG